MLDEAVDGGVIEWEGYGSALSRDEIQLLVRRRSSVIPIGKRGGWVPKALADRFPNLKTGGWGSEGHDFGLKGAEVGRPVALGDRRGRRGR